MLREWIKQGAVWEETDLDRKLALDTRGDHWRGNLCGQLMFR